VCQRAAQLARHADALLAASGQRPSAAVSRRVAHTLQAAAVGDDAARAALAAGTLVADLAPASGFGAPTADLSAALAASLGGEPAAEPEHARGERKRAAADERKRVADERKRTADERKRVADERKRVADERKRAAARRRQLASAERAIVAGRRTVEHARAAVEAAEVRLRAAKDALAAAELAAAAARRAVDGEEA
jgi:hypothetical protein